MYVDFIAGKTFKFIHGDWLKLIVIFQKRSDLNYAKDYLGAVRGTGQAEWDRGSAAGPLDFFRRTADNLIVPFAKAATQIGGLQFDPEIFNRRFSLEPERAAQKTQIAIEAVPGEFFDVLAGNVPPLSNPIL